MIIVDTALQRRHAAGNPVRVAMIGAGYMARGIALQIISAVKGMELVGIANRHVARAEQAFLAAGVTPVRAGDSDSGLQENVAKGRAVVTDDLLALCRMEGVEAIIEATGEAEIGAAVALEAIRHGKHIILMNAEVDATVGPILKAHADRAGVVYTYTDGDEPGVAMNLFRFVASIGYRPVLLGQIKGFLDRYRNPETQRAFAEAHKQKPAMVASFADGSKLAIESAIIGNATGFQPGIRGMHGHRCAHVKDLLGHFGDKDFEQGGLVDFVLGAEPHTGAFVMGFNDQPVQKSYMKYFKMGDGPYYMFYTPYHLPHLQLPHTVARAVLFSDPTLTPLGAPVCDTVSVAKKDLKAGEVLDGMGGFAAYGLVERYEVCSKEDYLPIPLSGGCRLKRDIPKDRPISYRDVELPKGRLCDRLRAEQAEFFGGRGASAIRSA